MALSNGNKPFLATTLHQVPGSSFAALGIGSVLISSEADKLSMITTVDMSGNHFSVSTIFALAVICVVFLFENHFFRRRSKPNQIVYFLLACIMSVSIIGVVYYPIGIVDLLTAQVARVFMYVIGAVLLSFWVIEIQQTNAKNMATICAIALIFDAATYFITAFLRAEVAGFVIALLPLVSIGAWFLWLSYTQISNNEEEDVHSNSPKFEAPRMAYILLGISATSYAIVFGQVHYQWTLLQDQSYFSLVIQLGAGMGVFLAALILLLLARWGWKYHLVYSSLLLIAPLLLLALYLSVTSSQAYVFVYMFLLNAAHKVVLIILVFMAAYNLPSSCQPKPFCSMYLAYFAGITASSILLDTVSSENFSFITIIAVGAILICVVSNDLLKQTKTFAIHDHSSDNSQDSHSPQNQKTIESTNQPNTPEEIDSDVFDRAIRDLSDAYQLTKRETQVLALLARGYNAASIASELVISTTTAKTHIRNIYSKLDIHSQQDVISRVHHTLNFQREAPQPKKKS